MYSIMFPTRFGLTVGSVEFEKVIECFEIENEVLFERKQRNVEVKDCTVKHNGLQEENLEFSCGIKQGSETIVDGLDSIKDLSLESNRTSPGMGKGEESTTKSANPNRKLRSNSTPNISSEKLKGLWLKKKEQGIRRNSTNKISSKRQPESEKREAISNHGHEKSGETNRVLAHGNRPIRNRRASLPSCRCSSGPETYTSNLNETSSLGNSSRMRRFILPASKTSEKFPRIMRNVRNGSENDINLSSNIPDDLGKDVSLEHVFRLWNVRLPKYLANDLKRTLAHE